MFSACYRLGYSVTTLVIMLMFTQVNKKGLVVMSLEGPYDDGNKICGR